MTNKRCFLLAMMLVFIGLAGISCSANPMNDTPVISTTVPATEVSLIPSITSSATLLPTLVFSRPTSIPYPTASSVKANVIAFIERDQAGKLSLWVANVDGSGERKLTGITRMDSQVNVLMQWSPNGKWISYRSADELWMVSRDGSVKRKLLSFPDESIGKLYTYTWSPDSSKIAYIEKAAEGPVAQITVGILNLVTEEVSEIASHQAPDPMPISWSPDGKYILFVKDFSYIVYEVAAREIAKEIKPNGMGCWVGWNTWSPSNKWFFDLPHGNGRYFRQWICVSGLDGSNREIHVEGTTSAPVWDKTGNVLYFVARKTNPDSDPNLKIDERLMRYDVRTGKTERLLSLREIQTYGYIGQVSISPDGNTLGIQTQDSESQVSIILIDLKSFSIKKISFMSNCVWTADSEIFVCLSHLNGYSVFYKLNTQTGESDIFSGGHLVEYWATSPTVTSP